MTYCENELCESSAPLQKVRVSENQYQDATRSFCPSCENAYAIGVQHGTFRVDGLLNAVPDTEERGH